MTPVTASHEQFFAYWMRGKHESVLSEGVAARSSQVINIGFIDEVEKLDAAYLVLLLFFYTLFIKKRGD